MTSIRHFPATHPLPDWRNFGVMLRILLGINALALLAALAFGFAGVTFGVAFGWYLTGGKLPKIALRGFLSQRLRGASANLGASPERLEAAQVHVPRGQTPPGQAP